MTTYQQPVDIDAEGDGRRFAIITDAALDSLRRLIGVPIADTVEPWCYEVTRDNIRHYAHGIGDDNLLWCDPAYAATTRHGRLVAPPSFVFALSRILSGYVGGLPGIHAMWAGADLTWHRPLLVGTEVRTTAHLKDLVEHQTRFAGRAIQQIYHVEFTDPDGTPLVSGDSWCFRTERDTARELGSKYDEAKARPPMLYTEAQLKEIFDRYEAEEVRGAEPRYYQDVSVGDEVPPIAKGPMTVTGFIAFAQGWGGLYIRANKLAWKQVKKHPGLAIPNRFGIPDVPERVHWEDDLATAVGTPGAYDYGPERCSWLTHHITNWIGDDGFLRRHQTKIRHHNVAGDWILITGRITGKTIDHTGRGLVTVEQEARNQHGDLSALGTGTVVLPHAKLKAMTVARPTGHELDAPPWSRVEGTLLSTARAVRRAYDAALAGLGVNLSEASVLAHLQDSGPLTQTELARRIGTGRARMGAWIDGLAAKGAVVREADPRDRRVWKVALTRAGHGLWEETVRVDRSIRRVLRSGSTPDDRAHLDALLTLINRNADTLVNGAGQ